MAFIVAIDGPAGSGKGTITKKLAQKLKLNNIDTGAMYRSVTLEVLNKNINLNDSKQINEMLNTINIEINETNKKQIVLLNGEDVSEKIRSNEVTKMVSQVSAIKAVREKLVEMQRKIGTKQDIIIEGRDITTVVFPNADVKIYLDADVEERARRRYKQNQEKHIECSYEEVLKQMQIRDENDKNKEYGALKIANDAIVIDATNMSINEVTSKIQNIIKRKQKEIKIKEKIYYERPETARKKIVRTILKSTVYFLYRIVYRVQEIGEKDIKNDESYIICANHLNYLDAAAVVVCNKRNIRFVCKDDMFKKPVISWALHIVDAIPINREKQDIEAMKRSIKALKNKELLGIFPEGTRKGMAKNLKAKNGAAFMALRSKVKVIPVGIQGSFKPFTKVYLNYGKPLDFSMYYGQEKNKEVLEKVTKEIMDNIIMLTNQKK
mgnify:FL=1|jgi:cytidylate kinase